MTTQARKRLTAAVSAGAIVAGTAWAAAPALAQDPARPVYRCPGPPVLYTDALTPQQAAAQGCRPIENAPLTIVQTRRPEAAAAAPAPTAPAAAPAPAATRPQARIDPDTQRARDSDARRILAEELQREQFALAELRREYNDGQPERRGDERNYQRYLDRVAEMRAAIARKEADVAALRRELDKLGS